MEAGDVSATTLQPHSVDGVGVEGGGESDVA